MLDLEGNGMGAKKNSNAKENEDAVLKEQDHLQTSDNADFVC